MGGYLLQPDFYLCSHERPVVQISPVRRSLQTLAFCPLGPGDAVLWGGRPRPQATPWSPSSRKRPALVSEAVWVAPVSAALDAVPVFDAWKRQFMQDGEPLQPAFAAESGNGGGIMICPRFYSDRTRPATLNRLDRILRLGGFFPHRCRSCSHRFYKRDAPVAMAPGDRESRTADAMETP